MDVERIFIAAKPDAVQRGLVGEIMKRFEQRGLKLIGLKMIWATEEQARKHYKLTPEFIEKLGNNTRKAAEAKGLKLTETNEEIAQKVVDWNVSYITEGPIVAMAWEGPHAIEIGRKIVGHAESRQSSIGTIRGDYSADSYDLADALKRPLRNLVHASGNYDEASNELSLWFSKEELYAWKHKHWDVLYKIDG